MRRTVLAMVAAVGCGGGEPAVREGHRAVYATRQDVSNVSIASTGRDSWLAAWTEGGVLQGEPVWLALVPDADLPVHHAELPPLDDFEGSRSWNDLVHDPTEEGVLAWLSYDGSVIHEIRIDGDDGARAGYAALPARFLVPRSGLEALTLGGGIVAFGFFEEFASYEISAVPVVASTSELPQPVALASGRGLCDSSVRAAQVDARSALVLYAGCTGIDGIGGIDGVPPGLATVRVEGADLVAEIHEGGDTQEPGTLIDLVAVGDGFGSLWWTDQGEIELYTQAAPSPLALQTPAFTSATDVSMPRLLSTQDRIVVVWAEGSDVRGVVVDPASGRAGDPFDWPVDDDCPVETHVPLDHAVGYACVGPCEGRGCAERWLFEGRVTLSY